MAHQSKPFQLATRFRETVGIVMCATLELPHGVLCNNPWEIDNRSSKTLQAWQERPLRTTLPAKDPMARAKLFGSESGEDVCCAVEPFDPCVVIELWSVCIGHAFPERRAAQAWLVSVPNDYNPLVARHLLRAAISLVRRPCSYSVVRCKYNRWLDLGVASDVVMR